MESLKTYRREEWVFGSEVERLLSRLDSMRPAGQPVVIKYNRNDLCPCGSGQKFKRCCLRKKV